MDTAQWPQEIVVKPMEDLISNNNNNNSNNKAPSTSLERKVRPQKDHAVNCPRCNSTNTKFCYYNNYSLTQPRYFCKNCRRYWTEGGTLRNIPVGGGSRKKNKRSSSLLVAKKLSSHDLVQAAQSHLYSNPKIHPNQGQDLNMVFHPTQPHEFRTLSEFMQLPTIESTSKGQIPLSTVSPETTAGENNTTNANHHHLSALGLLNGFTSSRGLTPFMPMSVPDHQHGVYSSGFPSLQDYKPTLNFTLDSPGNGYNNLQGGVQQQQQSANNSKLLFPFEDLKQVTSTSDEHNNSSTNHDHNKDQEDSTNGYWSGMLGTGGPW